MIDTAIALNLLLVISFGVVEFGQYFYIRSTFESAARDAARASILEYAAQADPANAATQTLTLANVTFNSSWMTIVDVSNGNSTVTDVSTVPLGHALLVTIQANYSQIPNAFRPLYGLTGVGIDNARICSGQCQMIKE